MSNIFSDLIGIIADDFTGAIDAGVEFVRAGFATTLVIEPNVEYTTQVEVINTDSRDGDAATAWERTASAAAQMRGRRVFKKIDSTMRGHLADEITAILHVLGQTKAVVCPAAIEARRIVRAGQLWVHDALLHQSDFARDPRWPATTADMSELLRAPITHIPLATVRAGADTLAAAIQSAPTAIVTTDAATHADLDLISQAIMLSDSLPCGALGLARAWARCFIEPTNGIATRISAQGNGPILIVAGSRHPRTYEQLHNLVAQANICVVEASIPMDRQCRTEVADLLIAALSAGKTALIRAPHVDIANATAQRALLEILGDLTVCVCQTVRPRALVLTGGETASAISRQLGATGVRILGEVEVGIPWGKIIGGRVAGSLVVTKAGGFGSGDALLKTMDALNVVRHSV